ncbi:hypothetical protein QL285_027675 [Trifolium repens]|nr:hypothetical protein QL285_027675 [Trifolium repens]
MPSLYVNPFCDKMNLLPLLIAFRIISHLMAMGKDTKCHCPLWISSLYSWHRDPPLRVRTLHCLMKSDQIIINHYNINLMSLKRYNIVVWYCISLFSRGFPE